MYTVKADGQGRRYSIEYIYNKKCAYPHGRAHHNKITKLIYLLKQESEMMPRRKGRTD